MLEVKAGGVCFVKGEAELGAFARRANFMQIDEILGRAEVDKF